jgi:hypothetical protein
VSRDERLAARLIAAIDTLMPASCTTSSTRHWPPASDPTVLPCPGAAVRQGQLVVWFGSESNPAVVVPPIDLAAI